MADILTLFTEAFAARALPMFHEVQLAAIRNFQPQAYPQSAALAAMGALAASVLLYFIGRWLRRMPAKVSTEAQQARIQKMQSVAGEWLPWLLILSASPVGCVLIMAAGFFAIRPLVAGFAILAAELLWRLSPVL